MDLLLRRGRVVDDRGAPVPGALVWVETSDVPVPEIAIRCDDEGRFRIPLPPGRYVLAATAADGRIGGRLERKLDSELGDDLVIRLASRD